MSPMPWYAMVCPNGHKFDSATTALDWDVCDECGAKAVRDEDEPPSFMPIVPGGATFSGALSPEQERRAEAREYARRRREIANDPKTDAVTKNARLNKLHFEREHDRGALHSGELDITVPRGAVDAPDRPPKFYAPATRP